MAFAPIFSLTLFFFSCSLIYPTFSFQDSKTFLLTQVKIWKDSSLEVEDRWLIFSSFSTLAWVGWLCRRQSGNRCIEAISMKLPYPQLPQKQSPNSFHMQNAILSWGSRVLILTIKLWSIVELVRVICRNTIIGSCGSVAHKQILVLGLLLNGLIFNECPHKIHPLVTSGGRIKCSCSNNQWQVLLCRLTIRKNVPTFCNSICGPYKV